MPIRDRIRPIKHLQNKFFICVLENPKDPVNIASALRNISAFGVEKLYVVGGTGPVTSFEKSRENRRLTDLSVGANKWVFVRYFDTTAECASYLRSKGYIIAVTSSHVVEKENIDLYAGTFTQKKLAIWFGNESRGITNEAVALSDFCIRIPMGGIVESLNLGTSTGIILSYISYQRLKFVFEHSKVHFKSKGAAEKVMSSWQNFIDPPGR